MNRKYIAKIDGLPKEFDRLPFGRQLEFRNVIETFKATAKSIYFRAKDKSTAAAFREFKKLYRPLQWFLVDTDGPMYHDDSFQVWYEDGKERL